MTSLAQRSAWSGGLNLWRQTPLSFRIGTVILLAHVLVAVAGSGEEYDDVLNRRSRWTASRDRP